MAGLFEIVKQDFAATRAAFEDRDYPQMNIFANRLMSNVIFGDHNEKMFALPGFFMKDVAVDFVTMRDEAAQDELRKIASLAVDAINKILQPDFEVGRFWSIYLGYIRNVFKITMLPVEVRSYKENTHFTNQAILFLAKELFEGDSVFQHNGLTIRGFLQEADRLMRCHGANDRDIILFLLVQVINWLSDYYWIASSSPDGTISLDRFRSRLVPFLGRVKAWNDAETEQSPYANATNILCDGLMEWRLCFIRYLEKGRQSIESERKIELPIDTKKRIGDTIAEALRKDVVATRARPKR
jgi:hypothetical protein